MKTQNVKIILNYTCKETPNCNINLTAHTPAPFSKTKEKYKNVEKFKY